MGLLLTQKTLDISGMPATLVTLDLGYNALDDVITAEHLSHLNRLKHIDLSYTSLKIQIVSEWQPPFRLESASFQFCQMGPRFPAWLQSQKSIDSLDMSSTGLSGKLPHWFATTFSRASELNFYNNSITGELPKKMRNMSLQRLFLGSNQLKGRIPHLPVNLTQLDLSRNYLSGPLPSNLPNLSEVVLFSNNISGRIPKSICQSQDLATLDLANNRLEGKFPRCFNPKNIVSVLLSNNRFTGKFPSFLERCTQLVFLDLGWNEFHGRLPVWIGDLVRLEVLALDHNKFFGGIPDKITNISCLIHLNLAANNISGAMPQHLSNFTSMSGSINGCGDIPDNNSPSEKDNVSVVTKGKDLYYDDAEILDMVTIDLSSNYLTGDIPEEITSLLSLRCLNLSGNHLSGKIPNKIGILQSLESLDLSRNNLSGEIPSSLSNLTFLSDLDLSFNNLRGTIPSGSQLDSLYTEHPRMFDGNGGLCGPPLGKNCYVPQKGHMRRKENFSKIQPFHVGILLGFIAGLWVVFCIMLFKKSWRIAYFRLFDSMYDKVYVLVVVSWGKFAQENY